MKLPELCRIDWPDARRLVRVASACVNHFDDIAEPADWALLGSAVRKTDPRLAESVGNLELIPARRRVADDAGVLMGPFAHVSYDRPSRFSTGRYGVLYAADTIEAALMQTIHQHERFLLATGEAPGWTSSFREIVLAVAAELHDIRDTAFAAWLDGENYAGAQGVAEPLHAAGSQGIVYPSTRWPGGQCVALFYPDLALNPSRGRVFDFHWNGRSVDFVRDRASDRVMRVERD